MKSKQIISAGILLFIVSVFAGCSKKDDNSTTGTCSDGIQNQTETGVDCGGPCSACAALPVADFTFTGAGVPAPASVSFTNSSTNATSYSWNFGDGGTSTATNPSHIYGAEGTYNVTLTATGTAGSSNKTKALTILLGDTQVYVTAFTLDTIPFSNLTGGTWDPADGPDVYFKFTKGGNVLYSGEITGTVSNVTFSSFPLGWVVFPDLLLKPITDQVNIEIWDNDGATDEMIGSIPFIPANYPGSPTSVTLTGSNIRVHLELSW